MKIRTFLKDPKRLTIYAFKRLHYHYGKFRLRKYLYLFNIEEAIEPDYSDLWILYTLVKKRRPNFIVEFGSGHSTLIMAQALYNNRRGFLVTLEPYEYWLKKTKAAVPRWLWDFCKIRYAPITEVNYKGRKVCKSYPEILKNQKIDFLYLDGGLLDHNKLQLDPIALQPEFMVIDGRRHTREFLEKEMLNYKFKYRKVFSNALVEKI